MKIILFFCDKIKPREFSSIESLYIKRLKNKNIEVIEYKNSSSKKNAKTSKEFIVKLLKPNDYVVMCDEKGDLLSTNDIVSLLKESREKSQYMMSFKRLVFIIGGSNGFSDNAKNNAHLLYSLSGLVLAGGIARVVLLEAIYRGMMILDKHPYHNE